VKYRVIILPSAQREIDKLPKEVQGRIYKRIIPLEINPRGMDANKLKGLYAYRIRVGDYRVIYEINDDIITVFVIHIAHRKDLYR
jgi:mRNA interferase RelE/StbE